ncbi:DNA-binding protein HU [Glaciimonas immobilis]|nr:DNA-binding protein HU [Glaciimonas immobilis]
MSRALDILQGPLQLPYKKIDGEGRGILALSPGKCAARSHCNPRTGASFIMDPAKVPQFKVGKASKDAVN